MWTGEIYNQFVFTFAKDNPSYSRYSFPFQFGSMPLYTYVTAVGIFLIISKDTLNDKSAAISRLTLLIEARLAAVFVFKQNFAV